MVLQAQDRSYEKTQRDQQRDSRRCHAGARWAGRGPSWRIRARWVGSTLQRFRHGAEDGGEGGMAKKSALLFGRRTYENFASYWPFQTDNPFTEVLDNTQKYVASRTLGEPLPWKNSTLLKGDAAEAVATLKESEGPDLVILAAAT